MGALGIMRGWAIPRRAVIAPIFSMSLLRRANRGARKVDPLTSGCIVPAMQTGSGGGIPYVRSLPSSRMLNQEKRDSCAAACGRQLLLELGCTVDEASLREAGRYAEGYGMTAENLASALNRFQGRVEFVGGGGPGPGHLDALTATGSWIARLKSASSPAHMIIIDAFAFDRTQGIVWVRDPWGENGPGSGRGLVAEVALDDFLELWRRGIHNAVWRR
jgi:hypothetical protein